MPASPRPIARVGAAASRAARDREARADRELLSAGIEPGHPSLYPTSEADLHDTGPGA